MRKHIFVGFMKRRSPPPDGPLSRRGQCAGGERLLLENWAGYVLMGCLVASSNQGLKKASGNDG